jgi:hypothetical protein
VISAPELDRHGPVTDSVAGPCRFPSPGRSFSASRTTTAGSDTIVSYAVALEVPSVWVSVRCPEELAEESRDPFGGSPGQRHPCPAVAVRGHHRNRVSGHRFDADRRPCRSESGRVTQDPLPRELGHQLGCPGKDRGRHVLVDARVGRTHYSAADAGRHAARHLYSQGLTGRGCRARPRPRRAGSGASSLQKRLQARDSVESRASLVAGAVLSLGTSRTPVSGHPGQRVSGHPGH